jgi:hypothetical protein
MGPSTTYIPRYIVLGSNDSGLEAGVLKFLENRSEKDFFRVSKADLGVGENMTSENLRTLVSKVKEAAETRAKVRNSD